MRDHHRPRHELASEVVGLRKQVADLLEAMTRHQRVEGALRHGEAQLHALLDGCPAGLCLIRRDGIPILANRSLTRLLGCDSVDELLATASEQGIFVTRDEHEHLLECIRRAGTYSGVVRLRSKAGGIRPIWTLGCMPEDEPGMMILVVLEDLNAAWHADTHSASDPRGV